MHEMINVPAVLWRILAFAAIAFIVGAGSMGQAPVDDAPTPPRSRAASAEYDRLLQYVNIPSKSLPQGVQLVQRVDTAPLVPFTRNFAVLADPAMISHVAVFFGINDQADLRSVRAGVAAIYEEDDPSHEIGVYGLWFSDTNAAHEWSKKLKERKPEPNSERSPFVLKDDLLLYVWKDDGVSDEAFAAIRDYFEVARLRRHSR
jgi:hypothetical protein